MTPRLAVLPAALAAFAWADLWRTPDQQAQRLEQDGAFAAAAEAYTEPMRRGAAWYKARDFKRAAAEFARLTTPEGRYNLGTAQVMLGDYEDAIESFDQALDVRPDWTEARENRALAAARLERVKAEGGEAGDQRIGADEIVFDKQAGQSGGQDTEVAGEQAATDEAVQAMWLRQVQTDPADFLKAKFAAQLARETAGGPNSDEASSDEANSGNGGANE